jgi:hypothetical protein
VLVGFIRFRSIPFITLGEHSSDTLGFLKGGEYIVQIKGSQFLKKDFSV